MLCRWILKRLGDEMTDEEIDDIIIAIDTDGSGTVDYNGEWQLLPTIEVLLSLNLYVGANRASLPYLI